MVCNTDTAQATREAFLEALLETDRLAAWRVLESASREAGLSHALDSLMMPALEIIGKLWETGEVALAQVYMSGRFANDENGSANAAADALQIPVVAYDHEGRNEYYQQTNYFDRETQLNRQINSWRSSTGNAPAAPAEAALLGPLLGNAARSRDHFMLKTGPEVINSEGFDRIMRLKHFILEELMPELSARGASLKDLAGEFAFFRDEWHERNRIMAGNIATRARKRPGRGRGNELWSSAAASTATSCAIYF